MRHPFSAISITRSTRGAKFQRELGGLQTPRVGRTRCTTAVRRGSRSMKIPYSGGCACGAVRYECSSKPLASYFCHCRDCQRETGSAFASCIAISANAFRVTKGDPKKYESRAESGGTTHRFFCPDCGSPLHGFIPSAPETVTINVGSLDDPSWFEPTMSLWTIRAQAWTPTDPALRVFEKQPSEQEVQEMFAPTS